MFDHPFRFGGHDRHAPPNSLPEGPACRVRRTTLDEPFGLNRHALSFYHSIDRATAKGSVADRPSGIVDESKRIH